MQILSQAKQDCSSERNIGQQTTPLPDGKRVDASWAVLLAGGDGSRLQSMTTQISGDARPKQFSSIVGDKSLLSQTRDRIRPIFDPRRTLFVVTRKHEHFYLSELSGTPRHNIIEQPVNRGTGVAIAIALLHILEKDQDAVVTFLPCDHHYSDPAAFEEVLSLALRSVPEHPSSIILVGAEPTSPEIEYGWIQPVSNEGERKPRQLQRVSRFWEKPALATAQELFRSGCLWNTFVTVGRADTFLQAIADEAPDVVLGLTAAFWNGDMETAFSAARTLDFLVMSFVARLIDYWSSLTGCQVGPISGPLNG